MKIEHFSPVGLMGFPGEQVMPPTEECVGYYTCKPRGDCRVYVWRHLGTTRIVNMMVDRARPDTIDPIGAYDRCRLDIRDVDNNPIVIAAALHETAK